VEISDLAGKGECLLTVAVSNIIDYTTLPVGGKSSLLGGGLPGFEAKGPKKPVNNPNFDFFNYCGIIRPVRIYTTPKSYISDVTVTAEVKENRGQGAAIGSGSSINKKDVSTAQIHITGGKINVYALSGAGIGSGSGSNAQVIMEAQR